MKKLLGIVVLGLFLSSNAYAGWFDKKIEVKECYDPKEYKNYKQVPKSQGRDWSWEIDLEKDTAILSFILWGELNMKKHIIKMKTDKYIIATDNETADVQFDLKNELYMSKYFNPVTNKNEPIILKCNFD